MPFSLLQMSYSNVVICFLNDAPGVDYGQSWSQDEVWLETSSVVSVGIIKACKVSCTLIIDSFYSLDIAFLSDGNAA